MPETVMTTAVKEFLIPEDNFPGLQVKIAKLSRKAVKITGKGFDFRVVEEVRKPAFARKPNFDGNFTRVPKLDEDGNRVFDIFYKVVVEAVMPKIEGWTFVATIDHSQGSIGNLIHISPACGLESVPEKYRTVGARCDHCGYLRQRKDTFLLREDATGEFKQIGRQCIRDFIGYDVAATVAMEELLHSAVHGDVDEDMPGNWMRDDRAIRVRSYLAHVAAVIRKRGWRSKSEASRNAEIGNYAEAHSTSSMALSNMFARTPSERKDRIALTDKDFAEADAALEWARTMTPPNSSNYLQNLHVIAKSEIVEYRSTGLLASVIMAFARATEQEVKRAERRSALNLQASQYVGTVGERLRNVPAILYGYYALPEGRFGARYILRFRSDDGNVLIWIASAAAAEDFGASALDAQNRIRVVITGTVKQHKEYEGVKQTYLSRCSIVRVEEPKEEAA